jgi:hypothetical protein
MRNRKLSTVLVGLTVATVFLVAWSAARSQGPPVTKTGGGSLPQGAILRSAQKPKAPVTEAKVGSAGRERATAAAINHSMRARRDQAWEIVKQVWEPVQVPGGRIPTWMTWYEQQDIEQLYAEMVSKEIGTQEMTGGQRRPSANTGVSASVAALLKGHPFKDLQASLNSVRLGAVLRQFTFPEVRDLGPNHEPSTGAIYYNSAYVKHLLENATRIARCDLSAFPNPLELRPEDPNNIYALCMDHEMPPDAMMIKVTWSPVIGYDAASQGYVNEHVIDTSANMAPRLSSLPAGHWIEIPWDENSKRRGGIQALGFRVADEKGKEWELRGMHIASKILRTWMWTSVFEAGGRWNWGADKPEALTQEWAPFVYYGMCTVSDFKESDPTPWAAYEGKEEHLQSLADTLKAVAKVMNGAQWCANPYIETNMAHGNCIGCHQGSTESVLPTTLFQALKPVHASLDNLIPEVLLPSTLPQAPFNTSDFSFSFATNRAAFQRVIRQHAPRKVE